MWPMLFDKRHKAKFKGIMIFLSVIMILGMVLLYFPAFN